jgi:hypothetical protein
MIGEIKRIVYKSLLAWSIGKGEFTDTKIIWIELLWVEILMWQDSRKIMVLIVFTRFAYFVVHD